jgi:hypothetical protein
MLQDLQKLKTFLTRADYQQLNDEGHSIEHLVGQIKIFELGLPPIILNKAAKINDGIKSFNEEQVLNYCRIFDEQIKYKSVIKFTPASGAASRMFKELQNFYKENKSSTINDLKSKASLNKNYACILEFVLNIKKFAFYDELDSLAKKNNESVSSLIAENKIRELIELVISSRGLNYANLPKGEIIFHRYHNGSRTAFEEHLVEAAGYSQNHSGEIKTHFTIPEESQQRLIDLFEQVKIIYKSRGLDFSISTSFQNKSTDTLAVDLNNNPFRDSNGKLLFRPAGHGALLQNLNEIDEDIIFIKNIDNISPEYIHPQTVKYKKLLGGILIEVQNQIFNYINKIVSDNVTGTELHEVETFSVETLSFTFPPEYNQLDIISKAKYLFNKLNRPLRICGMVVNEGHPGGGPFWIEDDDRTQSLQIIESAQIDLNNEKQKLIFNSSTHFNPVDIVCSIKDYRGNKFDLQKYLNPSTGLIALKSKDGRELKSFELPGLWNGSMHYWNTIFVEVPKITFNPVKEINDLLKAAHQSKIV